MNELVLRDRDELIHKLRECFAFYRKEVTELDLRIWTRSMASAGVAGPGFVAAVDEYYASGKYMPRPAEIIELHRANTQHNRTHTEAEVELGTPADDEVAAAWIEYNRRVHGWPVGAQFGEKTKPMTWDRVLEIVNEAAARNGMPEALEPEHRLEGICA